MSCSRKPTSRPLSRRWSLRRGEGCCLRGRRGNWLNELPDHAAVSPFAVRAGTATSACELQDLVCRHARIGGAAESPERLLSPSAGSFRASCSSNRGVVDEVSRRANCGSYLPWCPRSVVHVLHSMQRSGRYLWLEARAPFALSLEHFIALGINQHTGLLRFLLSFGFHTETGVHPA